MPDEVHGSANHKQRFRVNPKLTNQIIWSSPMSLAYAVGKKKKNRNSVCVNSDESVELR